MEALHKLAILCGLRQGKLLGLRWDDLDWQARRLQIRRIVHRTVSKGIVIGEPKTSKGRRPILLPDTVLDSLRSWSIRQKTERLLAGSLWQDTGHIFTSRVGTPLEPHKVHSDFVRLSEALGLPKIRFHDLRHTCATLLLSQGVHPKVVQELLGHSSIGLTMDTYSHVLPSMQMEAVNAMERLFSAP